MGYINRRAAAYSAACVDDGGGAVACSTDAPLVVYRLFRTARRSHRGSRAHMKRHSERGYAPTGSRDVVITRRQVAGDKFPPDLGDQPANDLRAILRRGNHGVQAILCETGLCNKGGHVVLLVLVCVSRQLAEPQASAREEVPGILFLCNDARDNRHRLGATNRLRQGIANLAAAPVIAAYCWASAIRSDRGR